ncbi:DUF4265 domain-containing protein [Kitasatospora sp. NPDC057936]|uniref:DUF4265 domain-containing protein n=1 Tax=Kitasatospora sp. NPDC057936 TaxID=3346283 RepID=UPI0036D9AC0D
MPQAQPHHNQDHVTLLADLTATGPVFEVLPAVPRGVDLFELTGSPGLTLGCAAGDIIRRAPDGRFSVERRGPNYCIQVYRGGPFSEISLEKLSEITSPMDGVVESPPDRRFAVVTVPCVSANKELEELLDSWANAEGGVHWWFGNRD